MMPIDSTRTDLAREFCDNPKGPHSPELRRVLVILREGSIRGKMTIASLAPEKGYCLAELGPRRGDPIVYHRDRRFDSIKDAMRAVFLARWEQATGTRPQID